MERKIYKRIFHVKGRVEEIEVPQPTKWERLKDFLLYVLYFILLIFFGVIMLAAISTTNIK